MQFSADPASVQPPLSLQGDVMPDEAGASTPQACPPSPEMAGLLAGSAEVMLKSQTTDTSIADAIECTTSCQLHRRRVFTGVLPMEAGTHSDDMLDDSFLQFLNDGDAALS